MGAQTRLPTNGTAPLNHDIRSQYLGEAAYPTKYFLTIERAI
jgi:hypothetical protein